MGCIYRIRNIRDGKRYVGKTTKTMECRRAVQIAHAKAGKKGYLFSAIRKYGVDAFEWEVLFYDIDDDILSRLERLCIKMLKTKAPNGYNLSDGGDGCSGFVRSKEWREKVSKALMGHPVSDKTRKAVGEATKRRVITKKTREKISQANKGRIVSKETRLKIGRSNKITASKEENKRKRSILSKRLWQSPEYRRKVLEGMRKQQTLAGCQGFLWSPLLFQSSSQKR